MTIFFVQITKEELTEIISMQIISNGSRDEKTIYLTFDDGFSSENTNEIINILNYHNIPATFFFYGKFMEMYPDLINKAVQDGYLVCNHTLSHKSIDQLSKNELIEEVKGWEKLYERITKKTAPLIFRPPQGKINKQNYQVLKSLGYEIVKWDVQIYDYDIYNDKGTAYVINSILKQTKNGSIILMHTMTKSNVNALETLIDELLKKGFHFGNLIDLVYLKI